MTKKNIRKGYLITLAVAVLIMVVTAAYFYYSHDAAKVFDERKNEIKTIAELKSGEIQNWIKERKSDINVFVQSPLFKEIISENIKNPTEEPEKSIIKQLELIKKNYDYDELFITTIYEPFRIVLKTGTEDTLNIPVETIKKSVSTGEVEFSDFYICPIAHEIHLDFSAPLMNNNQEVFASIVFRIDPNKYLYPLISNWPGISKEGETLILRKEGDYALVLNELLHQKDAALKLKLPITETQYPSVQAILGYEGVWDGQDYMGESVLSYIKNIEGTNWYLVAKVNKDVIFEELNVRAVFILIIGLLIISFSTIGLAYFYSTRQKDLLFEISRVDKELLVSQSRFKAILYSIGDAVITTDESGIIRQLNSVAVQMTGWREDEARGRDLNSIVNIIDEKTGERISNPVERIVKDGTNAAVEESLILISKDGKRIPISESISPIIDETKEIQGVVLVLRDQTENYLKQKALEKSEAKYKHIVENSLQGIVIFQNNRIKYINPAASKITGYSSEYLSQLNFNNLDKIIHADDLNSFKDHLVKSLKEPGYTARILLRIISESSELLWVECEVTSTDYDDGNAIQLVFIDITKLFESQLKTSNLNSLLRTIQSVNQLIVRTNDREELLQEVCTNFVFESGYKHAWIALFDETCMLSKFFESGIPDKGKIIKEYFQNSNCEYFSKVLDSDELIFLRKDDQQYDGFLSEYKKDNELLITSLKHLENTFGVMCVLREKTYSDIAEEKDLIKEISDDVALALDMISLDEKREKSEKTLANLINNLPGTAYRCQIDDNYTMDFLSNGVLELTGYKPDELINNKVCSYADIIHPDDINYVNDSVRSGVENNTTFTMEYRIISKDNEIKWVWEKGSVVYDKIENKNILEGIIHDITDLKQSQIEVNRLTTAVNSTANGMIITNLDAEILWVNPAFTKLTGYSLDEVIGEKTNLLLSDIHTDEFYNNIWNTVKSGKVWQDEIVTTKKDGSLSYQEMTITPVKDENGVITNFIAVITDITERMISEGERAREYEIQKALTELYSPIISSDADIVLIAENILNNARQLTGAEEGFVSEIEWNTGEHIVHTISKMMNECEIDSENKRLKLNVDDEGKFKGLWGIALNKKEPFFANYPANHPQSIGIPEGHVEIKNFLAVPILSNEHLLGEIALANSEAGFTEKDIEVVKRLGEFYGFAIQKQRTQKELVASEEKYRLLAENSTDIIWKMDTRFHFTYINKKGADVLGFTPEEMIGTPLWKYTKKRDFMSVARKSLAAMKNYKNFTPVVFESKILAKDGKIIPVEITEDLTISPKGKLIGIQGVIRNITERKKAQAAEKRNRKIAETLYGLSKLIGSDDEIIIDITLEKIVEYTDSEGGILFFFDRTELKENYKYSNSISNLISDSELSAILNSNTNYWQNVIQKGKHRISENPDENKYLHKTGWEVSKSLTVPLVSGDSSTLAVCVLGNKLENYSDQDVLTSSLLLNEMWQLITRKRVEKRIIESEKRFRSLYENATLGMYQLSPEGKFILANPALLNMLGYESISEISSAHFDISEVYTNNNYKKEFEKIMKTEGVVYGFESKWKKVDGTIIDVRESANAVHDENGKVIYYEGVVEDISDKKLSEQYLIKAKEKAEKMDRMKSEFLAQMSHEIRTPINSMLSFSSLIEEEVKGKIEDDLQSSFGMIYSAGKRIIRTIDLLLNMSELQTGNYDHTPKPTDLHRNVLSSLYKEFSVIAKNKGLTLNYYYPNNYPKLIVDQYSVSQIFRHLIDNAVIYTKTGEINIRFVAGEDSLLVEVEDSGIGISKEYLENLFEPFSQEEQGYSRKFEGNGLGLALVKRYCELNGAKIKAESEKGKGTKFSVLFGSKQIIKN